MASDPATSASRAGCRPNWRASTGASRGSSWVAARRSPPPVSGIGVRCAVRSPARGDVGYARFTDERLAECAAQDGAAAALAAGYLRTAAGSSTGWPDRSQSPSWTTAPARRSSRSTASASRRSSIRSRDTLVFGSSANAVAAPLGRRADRSAGDLRLRVLPHDPGAAAPSTRRCRRLLPGECVTFRAGRARRPPLLGDALRRGRSPAVRGAEGGVPGAACATASAPRPRGVRSGRS